MKGRSKKGEIDKEKESERASGRRGKRGTDRDKEEESASERGPQCEYGVNVNGLLNALDENKNQM